MIRKKDNCCFHVLHREVLCENYDLKTVTTVFRFSGIKNISNFLNDLL